MRSCEEHLAAILDGIDAPDPVRVPLRDALGLVAAQDVVALVDLPRFDNSAMDGYAVVADSLADADPSRPVSLPIVGEVPAGQDPAFVVRPGEAARIMTGARLPDGADAVLPVEQTDGAATGHVACRAPVSPGQYVRRRGEDLAAGSVVASRGRVLGPRSLALLAASGQAFVAAAPRPHVVVLSTGSELVGPGEPLGPGQIYDSNSVMLQAAAIRAGATAEAHAAVADSEGALVALLAEVLDRADVVVSSGGVSMGAYDVVKAALREEDVDFVSVAMQPGKPQGFGFLTSPAGRRVPIFALPGNPVSAYVSFEVFVRPALRRLSGRGCEVRAPRSGVLTAPLRSPQGRRQFARAVATCDTSGLRAEPVHGQGSHFVADLARANALVVVPEHVTHLDAGAVVDVLLLDEEG